MKHTYHIFYMSNHINRTQYGDTVFTSKAKMDPSDMEEVRKKISETRCDRNNVVLTGIFYYGELPPVQAKDIQ